MTLKLIQKIHAHTDKSTHTATRLREIILGAFSGCKKSRSQRHSSVEQRGTGIVKRCKCVRETKTGNMRKIGQNFGNVREINWLGNCNGVPVKTSLLPSDLCIEFRFFYVTSAKP